MAALLALLAKWAAVAGGALLGVAAVGALGGYLWLTSESGGRFVRERALAAAEDALAGRVEAKRVKLSGLLTVEMEDVRVYDPAGAQKEPVLAIERLFARLDLAAAAGKRVVVEELSLLAPRADAASLPGGGTTLTRALALKKRPEPAPAPEQPAEPLAWTIEVARAVVERGSFVLRPAPGAAPDWAARDLSLTLAGRHAADGSRAKLELRAVATREGDLRVTADVDAQLAGGRARVERLDVDAGSSRVRATGDVDLEWRDGRFDVAPVRVEASDLAKLFPWGADLGSATGELHATVREGRVELALDLKPARGTARITGSAGIAAPHAFDLTLVTRGLDPSALAAAAPEGRVEVELRARGHATPEPEADVELEVKPSQMLGLPISSAVRARYAAGEAQVHKLEVRTPGAEVKGHGRASAKALDLALDIHAQDLARLGRALKQAGLADLGSAGGSLRLEARARGPLNGFALEGSLVTHGVSVGTTRVSAVRGSVRIAGLPRRPEGAFDLRAAEIVAGETRLEKVRVFAHVDQKSRRVAGNLRAQVLGGEFHASLDGALAVDRKALALDTMGLGWPGAEFASERPVTIAWRDGVQVKDLALAGPAGRLAFDATQSRGGRIDARVRVGKLDLARLPAFLLPAGLGLAGLLDLDGSARGAAAQPEIEATASLVEGAFKEAHGIAARVEARVAAGRATATGTVDAGEAGRVELSAALPLGPFRVPRGERASPAVRAETLSARISAHEIDLPAVLRVAAPKLLERGAGGKVSLRADLGGKVGDPDLRAQVTGSGLRFEKLEGGAAQIDVRANAGAVKLDARADVEGVAGVKLAAAAPFDAARALLAPGDEVRRLLDAKAEVSLDEAVFDLGKLAALGFLPEDLRGRLSLAARIEGDRHAPRGSARIKLDRGAYLPLDGAGADLSVDAGEHSIEVQGTLSLPGAERVSLARASLGLSAGALFAGAAPLAAPLVFSLAAQDTSLESLLESLRGPPAAGESRTRFGGRADFSVEAEGTAETPVARVTFAARGLSADGAALGDATASLTYREGKAAAEAEVRGAAGGGMSALAELETKLSARGIDREAILSAPAGLSLRADRLDLRVLQPLVTSLTRLQGRLQAELRARGPLRELVPRGSARLEEVGFKHATAGEVKDLTVAAAVDGRRFKLSRLAGLFNRGQLEGEGAVDCSESPCKLNLDLSAGKVRIQQAGITRAIASLKVKSTGTLDGPRLEATLGLEDAHIEVPEIPTKRVQSLDPHPDVRVLGAVVEEEEPSSFVMRLTVRSPKPIAIRGRDIELDLHADRLVVERAEGELRLYGEMRGSPGGWFQLYGKEFSIDRAVVTMNGDPANPLLDVRARYINPQAKVAVSVAGPAQEPKVDFTSEPHMEKDQIVLFLATGRLQGRASDRGASAELSQPVLTAVGSFIAGTVREAIYAFAPLDLISVEGLDATAKSAQAAVAGISVKAGKYIGKLYVGGKVNLGASDENVAEAYVEWQATPEMSIEATFGDKHQAADFLYTIEK